MEPLILFLVVLAWKIISSQVEGKARREEEQARREEADTDRQEEMIQQTEQRKLPFEIPTIRRSDPNAETKLPQADRIFIRHEKTAEPEVEHSPKREPRREPTAVRKENSIDPRYLEKLAMKPTVHTETAAAPLQEEVRAQKNVCIPTSRDRLVEGIILAEILGRPKAYRKERRIR